MRRLEIAPKRCRGCCDWMCRKRYDKALEKPRQFAVREHCNKTCEGVARSRMATKRACLYCEGPLSRKRRPGGQWETRTAFRRRQWCNRDCRTRWSESTWYERERARAEVPLCAQCGTAPSRQSLASVLCASCGYRLRRIAERWIASTRGLERRPRLRLQLLTECEHGRIQGACTPCRQALVQELDRLQVAHGRRITKQFRTQVEMQRKAA